MQLLDMLIDSEPADLDWCADPSDLERAVARRLVEIEPGDHPTPVYEKLAQMKLASELGRAVQH
jgi:hypothetical protein